MPDGTYQKIEIPFYFSTTGDEQFLDTEFTQSEFNSCSAETFYNTIPRGVVNFEGIAIDEGGLTNNFINGSREIEVDGELRTYISEYTEIPIDINVSVVIYCDSHLDLLKCTQVIIKSFYKHLNFDFDYIGIRCRGSMEFPSDYTSERLIDYTYTDKKEWKITFDISTKTVMPIEVEITRKFAGDTINEFGVNILQGSILPNTQTNSGNIGNNSPTTQFPI